MTLIKELIHIPEQVYKGDFVLRLAEGVEKPSETLKDYVVTPQLRDCFDDALGFIRGAVEGRTSKAAFLHGSFGSGKSHFMAVLHLLLSDNAEARAIPELAPVVAKHNAWIRGRKFLLVPYHMIGARSMEAGILGGYADFVRRRHPEAAVPAVYRAQGLLDDARRLRQDMGDEAFLAGLNAASAGGGGWGSLESTWDAARFEEACAAPPVPESDRNFLPSEPRRELVSALIKSFFRSYHAVNLAEGEAYLSLDSGLSVLSAHAQGLGYDAAILLLDELILWLASHAADLDFVHREGQKLAKLVEAQHAARPAPIISFVARQRDLSELIGDNVTGADRLNFSDALRHWEGRFHRITLEDRNLPAIAEKRLLEPRSESARQLLDASFEETRKIREEVMSVLLAGKYDQAIFRKVYPFSPALVDTLVGVSSVLQRERTALRVMLQLLVEQRDTLELGDIVPVGDLFDVIAHGDDAFSEEMRIHFENAKRLYYQKLLPLLEKRHGRHEDLRQLPYGDPKRAAFRSDDRLLKTLLLAALVEKHDSLRGMTASRLVALNHGTIRTPIEGREAQEALRRLKEWAAEVGEIKVGEGPNPSVSIQLAGVDTASIIEQARREDNPGNRMRLIRRLLFEDLGVEDEDKFFAIHSFLWRNTARSSEVIFGNVRTLHDSSLENQGESWKVVIDYPFDEGSHTPQDDLSRLESFKASHEGGARTLLWIPAFFSREAQKELGTLVILEHVLRGEWFGRYSTHLSPQDRAAAKAQLENQRSALSQRVKNHLQAAYGLAPQVKESVDPSHELAEHFVSALPGFDPQPPPGPQLRQALDQLLDQALGHQFPAHPRFEAEVKPAVLRKVLEEVRRAVAAPDGRIEVEKPLRPLLRQIAAPLLLGEMHEVAFVLGRHWKDHFDRKAAESGGALLVRDLRRWIDQPKPMGLPREAQNLLIILYGEQTDRSFYRHGTAVEAAIDGLAEDAELRKQRLPQPADWEAARRRAAAIFGVSVSPLCNAPNLAILSREVRSIAEAHREGPRRLRKSLKERGVPAEAPRLRSVDATLELLEQVLAGDGRGDEVVVKALASARVPTSEEAMGECLKKGGSLSDQLGATSWEIIESVQSLGGPAREIRLEVERALGSDEHVIELAPALKTAQAKAVRLLTAKKVEPAPGKRVVDEGQRTDMDLEAARKLLAEIESKLERGRVARLRIEWIVEEPGRS
jgi:hypothetical protein